MMTTEISQELRYFTSVEYSCLTKPSKMTLEVMPIAQGSDDRRRKWKLPMHRSGKCLKRCGTIKKHRFGK
jgi:transglutaminase-like putative cysteine protease